MKCQYTYVICEQVKLIIFDVFKNNWVEGIFR